MKPVLFISFLLVYAIEALASASFIICGDQPGEIYFTGFIDGSVFMKGLYYSEDFGANIELIDTTEILNSNYGFLLKDAADSSLYCLFIYHNIHRQYFSSDKGLSWIIMNNGPVSIASGSGIIPGEVYRSSWQFHNMVERSINHGQDYTLCATSGVPYNYSISSTALNSDSGGLYIYGGGGDLYYSSDYGENFEYIINLRVSWGISQYSWLMNGAESGEFYIYYDDWKAIWRGYDYGRQVEEIENFPGSYAYWNGSIASSNRPGEIYFYACAPSGITWIPYLHIYHTTNYGQDWDFYEHIPGQNCIKQNLKFIPNRMSLKIYPNPANAGFNIFYELDRLSDVRLNIFDVSGRLLWEENEGMKAPGAYNGIYRNPALPSGTYFLRMDAGGAAMVKSIIIVK